MARREEKNVNFIVLTILLFLGSMFYQDVLWAQEYPWQIRIKKDGISVYTRKVEGSAILEFKADLSVDAPISKVISLFEDEDRVTQWYYQCISFELVEDDGPGKKIYHSVIDLPWPVTNRDSVFQGVKSIDPLTRAVSYKYTALPDRLPKEKGIIRVPYLKTQWSFTPLKDGRTKIYFSQHSSAGGSIPAFLVNSLVVDIPFNSLKNFRRLLAEPKK